MKILKSGKYAKEKPKEVKCSECHAVLEYDDADMHIGKECEYYIVCPECGCSIYLDEYADPSLSELKFPEHFHLFSSKEKAVDVIQNPQHIKDSIVNGIKYLQTHLEESMWYNATGNVFILIFKLNDDRDYDINVFYDYYNAVISYDQARR